MLALAAVAVSGLRADFDADLKRASDLVRVGRHRTTNSPLFSRLAEKAKNDSRAAAKMQQMDLIRVLVELNMLEKEREQELNDARAAAEESVAKKPGDALVGSQREEAIVADMVSKASRNALMRRIRGMVEWMKANPVLSAALMAGVAGGGAFGYGAYTGDSQGYLPAEDGWKRNVARANPAHLGALAREAAADRWSTLNLFGGSEDTAPVVEPVEGDE